MKSFLREKGANKHKLFIYLTLKTWLTFETVETFAPVNLQRVRESHRYFLAIWVSID